MQRIQRIRYEVRTEVGTMWASHIDWQPHTVRIWGKFASEQHTRVVTIPRELVRYVEEIGRDGTRPRRSMMGRWEEKHAQHRISRVVSRSEGDSVPGASNRVFRRGRVSRADRSSRVRRSLYRQ